MTEKLKTESKAESKAVVSGSALLNGKAKTDFELWLKKQPNFIFNKYTRKIVFMGKILVDDLPENYINTLIFEWLDSIGFHIGRDMVDNYWLENSTFYERLELNGYDYIAIIKTLPDAIKKANELYNADIKADR
jgi:hypothetical protein